MQLLEVETYDWCVCEGIKCGITRSDVICLGLCVVFDVSLLEGVCFAGCVLHCPLSYDADFALVQGPLYKDMWRFV